MAKKKRGATKGVEKFRAGSCVCAKSMATEIHIAGSNML